jgi:Arc/MetJ-type ribon-helix-helix transcriptional regulator
MRSTETKNVVLTTKARRLVKEQLKSGRFARAELAIEAGLALLKAQDEARKELNEQILAGLNDLHEGKVSDVDAFFRDLDVEYSGSRPTGRRRSA